MIMDVVSRYLGTKNAYLQGDPEDVEAVGDMMGQVLALLRALQWHYWTSHWQTKGDPYYGDHLLFDRLYSGDIIKEIDSLAEKIVGYVGPGGVDPLDSMRRTAWFLHEWVESEPDCLFRRSLEAEEDLQLLLDTVYHEIEGMGSMTLGLDDYIMALANAHETNIYLLQQRLRGHKMGEFDE
jgi:hypothetical protein